MGSDGGGKTSWKRIQPGGKEKVNTIDQDGQPRRLRDDQEAQETTAIHAGGIRSVGSAEMVVLRSRMPAGIARRRFEQRARDWQH